MDHKQKKIPELCEHGIIRYEQFKRRQERKPSHNASRKQMSVALAVLLVIALLMTTLFCRLRNVEKDVKSVKSIVLDENQLQEQLETGLPKARVESDSHVSVIFNGGESNDVLKRSRRSSSRGKIRKNRNERKKNKKNNRRRDSKRSASNNKKQMRFVQMVIDKQHPDRTEQGAALKTGDIGSVIPYWKYSDQDANYAQSFGHINRDGSFSVKDAGVYLLYSQLTYFDRTGKWSHSMTVNGQPFIKCISSEWGIDTDPDTNLFYRTIHQCHTSAVTYLQAGERVAVNSMYSERTIHEDHDMTFWGLLKF